MYTENSKISIALLEVIKEIYKSTIAEIGLNIPAHFDLMIDSFLISHIIISFPKMYDQQTEANMIDYIYTSNLTKIRMANLSNKWIEENYPFGTLYEDFLIDSFKGGYKVIASNEVLAKKLIKQTIELNVNEILLVNKSYKEFASGNGKVKLPVNFFINCFVHPILLFQNRDYIISEHQAEIENISESIYREITEKIYAFIDDFVKLKS